MSGHPERVRSDQWQGAGIATRAIHAGQEPDPVTGAIIPPVYMTSTYVQKGVGEHQGYDYSRTDNPTRRALEVQVAALELADHGIAFSSGMAAASTVLQTLKTGDHVICVDDVYGGTYRLFSQVLSRHAGIKFSFISMRDLNELDETFRPETRLVWMETPTNPMLNVIDIAAVADMVHSKGALLCVDNTFATPAIQRPIELGADIVAHSVTKYLGGHSDVVGGALVTSVDELATELRFLQNAVGAVPGPMDCWLVSRGIKTLPLRIERHSENAGKLVAMLKDRSDVEQVIWPGDKDHPQADVVNRQMAAGGGMFSFRVVGGVERAKDLVSQTRYFSLAESLGGVESLIEIPGAMTHQTLEGSALEVPADLIRVSAGIESADDLVKDLEQALENSRVPSSVR